MIAAIAAAPSVFLLGLAAGIAIAYGISLALVAIAFRNSPPDDRWGL